MSRSRVSIWTIAAAITLGFGITSLPSSDELRATSGTQRTELEDLERRTELARTALADEAAFAAEIGEKRTAVPSEPRLPDLINHVEGAVAASEMVWVSGVPAQATPAVEGESSAAQTWRMTMTVTGSDKELADLLEELATLERLVVVDSVVSQSASEGQLSVNLSLRFFSSEGDPNADRFESERAAPRDDDDDRTTNPADAETVPEETS